MATDEADSRSRPDVWDEVREERARAHAKHGDRSMEASPWTSERRLRILLEELGEVARELNDADIEDREPDADSLRLELIQVAAMAGAWADVIPLDYRAPAPQAAIASGLAPAVEVETVVLRAVAAAALACSALDEHPNHDPTCANALDPDIECTCWRREVYAAAVELSALLPVEQSEGCDVRSVGCLVAAGLGRSRPRPQGRAARGLEDISG
jgi:NTP pyrophosphatase (non-canonical NTP hydrolase)